MNYKMLETLKNSFSFHIVQPLLKAFVMYCLNNKQEHIIRFKNSRRGREFLHLIIHDCREFFERLHKCAFKCLFDRN